MFVHGMGFNDDRYYWKQWAEPLQEELAKKNLELDDSQFDGVYYYDLVPGQKTKQAQAKSIVQAHIDGLRKLVAQEYRVHRGLGIKQTGIINKVADYVVDNFGDIYAYLYHEDTFRKVNERLYEAVERAGDLVHLIGYSLGSIVSLCALMRNPAAARLVGHLLLLGSPLYWFRQGVSRHISFDDRPSTGRFTNLSAIADIAWPQKVPQILASLDYHVEFVINPLNPIKGHQEYFIKQGSLQAIASEIIKGWA